jgi:hypothetical protein
MAYFVILGKTRKIMYILNATDFDKEIQNNLNVKNLA